jgi:hypothetical protein
MSATANVYVTVRKVSMPTQQPPGERRTWIADVSRHPLRWLLRLIVAAVGVLLLLSGLLILASTPLSGLFIALTGLALVLASMVPGLITSRVPPLRRVPGGASVVLGAAAFLAFAGALATTPTPPPPATVLPTATTVVQAPPTTLPTVPPTTVPIAQAVVQAPAPTLVPPTTVPPTPVPPTAISPTAVPATAAPPPPAPPKPAEAPKPEAKTGGPSPEAQAYLDWLLPKTQPASQSLQGLSTQSEQLSQNPRLLTDNNWILRTGVAVAFMESTGKEMQTYLGPIPDNVKRLDTIVKDMGRDLAYVAAEYTAGIDQRSVARINNATTRMNGIPPKTREATTEIQALRGQ